MQWSNSRGDAIKFNRDFVLCGIALHSDVDVS